MSAIELRSVVSLSDVLVKNHFEFVVPNVPGGGNTEELRVRNMTAQLPTQSNNALKIVLHRHAVHFAAKRQYSHSFSAQFVETRDGETLRAIRNWQAQINDEVTNLPKLKSEYSSSALIRIFGGNNKEADVRTFYGVFPTQVSPIELAGNDDDAPIVYGVTINYDYWKYGTFRD